MFWNCCTICPWIFHKVLKLTPSLLVNKWAFWGWPLNTQSWYYHLLPTNLFTCRNKCFVLFLAFHHISGMLLSLSNFLETCYRHQLQNEGILTKNNTGDQFEHWMSCLCTPVNFIQAEQSHHVKHTYSTVNGNLFDLMENISCDRVSKRGTWQVRGDTGITPPTEPVIMCAVW